MAGSRILYIDLVLLTAVFFVLFDVYLFHLFLIFLLILPLLSLLAALPLCRALRCRFEAEEEIMPKGACTLRLTAENRSLLPCACMRVRISRRNALGRMGENYPDSGEETVQFSLRPRCGFTLPLELDLEHCGKVELGFRRVQLCDMLGLFWLPVARKNVPGGVGSVYVLPTLQNRRIETEDAADLGMDSTTYSTKKPGGDPSEIFQLREYREGDAQHSVHWKLSSRMNRLIVREFGLPLNPSLHFLLELRENAAPTSAEAMLGTVLAFSEYLLSRAIVHGISWLGDDGLLHHASITGADALAAALHELLALPSQKPWSALSHFVLEAKPRAETHLVYLIAGASEADASETDAEAERMLERMLDLGLCRRMTVMPDRCTEKTAARLSALGCDLRLLDGSMFGPGEEET